MLTSLILICVFFIAVVYLLVMILRYRIKSSSNSLKRDRGWEKKTVVGFFHPYCNAGGGGERVLWVAIRSLQLSHPDVQCIVYTGDCDATSQEILAKADQRFNITLPKSIDFVFLRSRNWVEAKKYPIFTLLGQSLGSLKLGLEALVSFVPDVYVDSMGYAFTLPLFKYFGGCKVACYVHYPTISTDMLERVSQREESFNNASAVSRSPVLTSFKLLYYKLFAYLYGLAGARSDMVMVNSTWTYGHIKSLWKITDKTVIVYPPCNISEFIKIDLNKNRSKSVRIILSIAQFRPEKNHQLQLDSFNEFLSKIGEKKSNYKLILVGGCRDDKDAQRVEILKKSAEELGIQDYVDFKLNVSFEDLKIMMSEATIGLHTMRDEHFGIGVVELMAAGTVTLAHDSAGPKLDILTPYNGQPTGYLALDIQSYAAAMETIFRLSDSQREAICENARCSVTRFSESEFERGFLAAMEAFVGGSAT
ncbi:GDP-Man:Man(3)GlcNAc(2)-PP-Dol alpha-1,2-mannosyltransferase-like isoform X2 [Mya arenaria]|nr:GDP-Man:Man(3)GlcNAc(2)-PP-Dol alpha-1,2-mannosyltransferase-like isoform X2 [Mya arenaria]